MRAGPKRVLRTGIVAGLAYAGWRGWQARVRASTHDRASDSGPFPFPPIPRPERQI
ncbi:MAG: hypothetical protein ACLPVY_20715 [Acidimicrobiia bacterium]